MTVKPRSTKSYFITVLWLIAAGVVMTLLTYPPTATRKMSTFLVVAALTSSMWVFLFLGNSIVGDLVSKEVEWIRAPVRTFIVSMLAMIIYTVAAAFFLVWIFKIAFGLSVGDIGGMLYTTLVITFIISLFMHSRAFLQNWKTAEIEAEKAKQETIKANYESLKNQVNPHFLFNSLNALTNLVYEDQDKAAKFIKQLSEVYRYVLDSRNKEVVTIAEELKFLNSYLFLQQIRFGDKLKIKNELNDINGNLPPLAIQMLVENAIKHNIVSQAQPLTIHLYKEDMKLVVMNNLQRKEVLREESSSAGLENISRRYEFLSDLHIEIIEDENSFIVKLPILVEET